MELLAATSFSYWPFMILLVSVGFVILAISKLRLPAFIALIGGALIAGLMAENLPESRESSPLAETLPAPGKSAPKFHLGRAVDMTANEFGRTAGGVAISIVLASIIGMCLMESGAADKVVRRFLGAFGEKNAGVALLLSTYVLSVPIFFDTMFMLMVPLAKALRVRTGKDYLLFVLVICAGGVVTHSMTVPHPGPMAMVDNLKVDVGLSILAGIVIGLPAVLGGWLFSKWLNRRIEVPLRETPGSTMQDLQAIVDKPESELPGFVASISPVIVPILLITLSSFFVVAQGAAAEGRGWATGFVSMLGGRPGFFTAIKWSEFIGDKNIALFVGTVLAVVVMMRQRKVKFGQLEKHFGPPLETAGTIILITAAGGAFGLMLRNAGMAEAIKEVALDYKVNLLVLGYIVSVVLRVAQGSATVAMLTTSAMLYPLTVDAAGTSTMSVHPMYLFLTIGFGAFSCSWMNDSGFWVVSRLGGLTEKEMLRTWTPMLTVVSLIGFGVTMVVSSVFPFR
jgi:gluconate:H+ symporter, GntP family